MICIHNHDQQLALYEFSGWANQKTKKQKQKQKQKQNKTKQKQQKKQTTRKQNFHIH